MAPEGFVRSENVTAELEGSSGVDAVMRSRCDGHVRGYTRALLYDVCVTPLRADPGASHVSPLGQRKGGGPRSLKSSCICVCYSGSAISLECSASCQIKVTTMVCTHTSAESPR